MKVLDFEAVKEIEGAISPSQYYDLVVECLRNKAEFQMLVKTRLSQDYGDYSAVMPSL